jgi:adenosylmethionine-8-amino-7-oxononanoate aminotransferase
MAHSTLLGLTHPAAAELAEKLVGVAPEGLARVFYSDNGSTAVEIAMKLAFQFWQLAGRTGKRRFVHLEQSYHGDTLGAVAVGGIPVFHEVFGPLRLEKLSVPTPHPYRHPSRGSAELVRDLCLGELARTLETRGDEIAAFHVRLRLEAERRPVADRRPELVARGQRGNAKRRCEQRRLCPLPGSGLAEEKDDHWYGKLLSEEVRTLRAPTDGRGS